MGLDIMTKWDSIYKGTSEVIYCLVRQFIGIGKDPQAFGIASARISKAFSLLFASILIVIIQTLSCWFFGLLRGSSFRCGNFARLSIYNTGTSLAQADFDFSASIRD